MSFVNRLKLVAIAVPRAMASSDESDIDDTRAKAQSGGEVAEMAMNGRLRLRAPVPDPCFFISLEHPRIAVSLSLQLASSIIGFWEDAV